MMQKNKAIFLDRDGVLNRELGDYVCKLEDFHVHEHNFKPLKELQDRGYLLMIATNQGGLAKGWYTVDTLNEMHDHLKKEYLKHGIKITAVYYCPHHPNFTGECDCRKPKPGMLLKGIQEHHLEPSLCYFIGDKVTDVEAADAAGVNGIKIEIDQPLDEILHLIA
ncbi:D-glycero-alpha-D-manno-heptose-1,7-bisphosphate 7-phosphatase [Pedobacter glucosidilyticus]|uniref:D-glycero-alpha-D-manno-heptose-1,7-bisphosphate 7-phosphatase n=1 Tax=Pedobacter glucosidilyticus TaxID=1122941 RepID=UPI0026F1D603|nr:HAD family hydrolase [Pedobacter glucosidilyticus]